VNMWINGCIVFVVPSL